MNWLQRNFKTIIYLAFLIPIITVAVVSISHVTKWYGITNPISWAIYLSIGIEIAALSALAAIAAQMGKKVYFPFIIVTLIQFLGNIYFAYSYIDTTAKSFTDWVEMVDPIVSLMGVESGDIIGHKRFLALFAGGMLPLISLTFLHMLVKFEEEDKKKGKPNLDVDIEKIDIDALSREAGKKEAEWIKDVNVLSEEDLKRLNEELEKINKAKFGNIVIEEKNTEDDTIDKPDEIAEENIDLPQNEEVLTESVPVESNSSDGKRVLSYLKRDV